MVEMQLLHSNYYCLLCLQIYIYKYIMLFIYYYIGSKFGDNNAAVRT